MPNKKINQYTKNAELLMDLHSEVRDRDSDDSESESESDLPPKSPGINLEKKPLIAEEAIMPVMPEEEVRQKLTMAHILDLDFDLTYTQDRVNMLLKCSVLLNGIELGIIRHTEIEEKKYSSAKFIFLSNYGITFPVITAMEIKQIISKIKMALKDAIARDTEYQKLKRELIYGETIIDSEEKSDE